MLSALRFGFAAAAVKRAKRVLLSIKRRASRALQPKGPRLRMVLAMAEQQEQRSCPVWLEQEEGYVVCCLSGLNLGLAGVLLIL